MNKNLFTLLGLIILFANCATAPRYEQPKSPVSTEWPAGAAYGGTQDFTAPLVAKVRWREFFADERLKKVIEITLENNRDFRIATLNVEKAQAMYGIQRAELFPTVDSNINGSKKRSLETGFRETDQYSVDFGISSWEIDFFGRLRHLQDQALEKYLATKEIQRDAQVLLIYGTAAAYLNLAADRENLKLAQTTFETQQQSYNLIKRRVEGGIATQLDLQQAQTQVDSAQVNISRYTQLTAQDENALRLLAGTATPIPEDLLPKDLGSIAPPVAISAGLPSELLLNRPDILAAEHDLKAAFANISAARTAFFPRISLTTTFGTASGDLSDLFSSGTDTWNYAPKLVMPIFDSRLWSAYKVSKTDKEIALNQYEKAIQTAFKEVADTLAVQGTVDKQITAQQSMVSSLEKAYQLANKRYTKGRDNYLIVLDAQRSLFTAQQQLVLFRLAKSINQANLYKVLGGGSEPGDVSAPTKYQEKQR